MSNHASNNLKCDIRINLDKGNKWAQNTPVQFTLTNAKKIFVYGNNKYIPIDV